MAYFGVSGTQNDRMSPLKSNKFSLSKSDKALSRYTLKRRFTPEISVKINLTDVLLQNTLGHIVKKRNFMLKHKIGLMQIPQNLTKLLQKGCFALE